MARYGKKSQEESQEGDARKEEGNIAQRQVRQEGDEPQAGHCHRTFGSAPSWSQSAQQEILIEEEIRRLEIQTPGRARCFAGSDAPCPGPTGTFS